jgi:hypothetical protein
LQDVCRRDVFDALVLRAQGRRAGEHFVQDQSKGKYIGAMIDLCSFFALLGRRIVLVCHPCISLSMDVRPHGIRREMRDSKIRDDQRFC